MRHALWPDATLAEHVLEMEAWLQRDDALVVVCALPAGRLGGLPRPACALTPTAALPAPLHFWRAGLWIQIYAAAAMAAH